MYDDDDGVGGGGQSSYHTAQQHLQSRKSGMHALKKLICGEDTPYIHMTEAPNSTHSPQYTLTAAAFDTFAAKSRPSLGQQEELADCCFDETMDEQGIPSAPHVNHKLVAKPLPQQ